ncbi:DegT/DnrJ/EryC1/StrS family aminotransferase [Mesorhizobium sp. ORM8.1]
MLADVLQLERSAQGQLISARQLVCAGQDRPHHAADHLHRPRSARPVETDLFIRRPVAVADDETPIPVHLLPAYADLGYKQGQFRHAERAAAEVLSLPMFPELTEQQQDVVVAAVMELQATVERAPLTRKRA